MVQKLFDTNSAPAQYNNAERANELVNICAIQDEDLKKNRLRAFITAEKNLANTNGLARTSLLDRTERTLLSLESDIPAMDDIQMPGPALQR